MNVNLIFEKVIIAVDFDGTIVEHKFPEIGELKKDAKEVINKLYDDGYYIIIWTCRAGYQLIDMVNFLKEKEIKYHKVNENAPFEMIGFKPSPKIFANIYIDDANLDSLPEWTKIYRRITGKFFVKDI